MYLQKEATQRDSKEELSCFSKISYLKKINSTYFCVFLKVKKNKKNTLSCIFENGLLLLILETWKLNKNSNFLDLVEHRTERILRVSRRKTVKSAIKEDL